MTPRSFTTEPTLCHDGFSRGFSVRTYRMTWLHLSGDGRWCVGGREAGKFPTEADAIRAGNIWIETGLPPAEQTLERIAQRMAEKSNRRAA